MSIEIQIVGGGGVGEVEVVVLAGRGAAAAFAGEGGPDGGRDVRESRTGGGRVTGTMVVMVVVVGTGAEIRGVVGVDLGVGVGDGPGVTGGEGAKGVDIAEIEVEEGVQLGHLGAGGALGRTDDATGEFVYIYIYI